MRDLRTENLDVGYDAVATVSGVNLRIAPGTITTLVGPNGAGKSTILKTLAGALAPVAGVVWLGDEPLTALSPMRRAAEMAVMTTSRAAPEYATCADVVAVGRYRFTGFWGRLADADRRAIDDALQTTGAAEWRDREFATLSDGQKQRVLLARALAQEPKILVMDEPTSFLDVGYKLEFVETLKTLVRRSGIAVVAALHELELVRSVSDVVVCVSEGRVDRVGAVDDVFQEEYLRKLFHVDSDDFAKTYGNLFHKRAPADRATSELPRVHVSGTPSRVKFLMIQGTMSNVGKSLLTAGLCRIFKQDGYRVAPFKSQNMALNSYVTADGLEMGRAQVMQAEACGVEPSVFMNPILLKPTDDCGSQVIVNGRAVGNMRAREYFQYKKKLVPEIMTAVERLAESADVIVIEGAGSPAEINLKADDIVNMGMAKLVDAPVLLVGDIDRGGVFAQLVGTLELLEPDERARVKGLVVNKFRGDPSLLDSGIEQIEKLAKVPVAGVVPWTPLTLDDEDSLSERLDRRGAGAVNIAVVRLPHLSNFTDFVVFDQVPGVATTFVTRPGELGNADMAIIPGTKNTISDARWLLESGLADALRRFAASGAPVVGVCGGYQILGESISDPDGVEGGGSSKGLAMLPVVTTLGAQKQLRRAEGTFVAPTGVLAPLAGLPFSGYEIHMGETRATSELAPFTSGGTGVCCGNVFGTYVHGLFDDAKVVAAVVSSLAARRGVELAAEGVLDYRALRDREYDKLAETLRRSLNMRLIYKATGLEHE